MSLFATILNAHFQMRAVELPAENVMKPAKIPTKPSAETPRLRAKTGAEQACPNSPVALDKRLDDALEQTFPASDPVSIMVCVR
jgi:hypothetical protein